MTGWTDGGVTDQERSGQVRSADLLQRDPELDPLQLGVVTCGEVLGAGTASHHGPHVRDPVVDVRHDGPPPAHLGPLAQAWCVVLTNILSSKLQYFLQAGIFSSQHHHWLSTASLSARQSRKSTLL